MLHSYEVASTKMTETLKVTVVLCTCDGEKFLAEQLLTLLTQSRLPDEVIVADDASTDGTWTIVQDFVALAITRGIDVRSIRRPNRLGYVANFSSCLASASGDVVFLCDQDDAWHPDKIAFMEARFVADTELTLLHTDARLVATGGVDLGETLFDALEVTDAERTRVSSGSAFDVYLRRNIATGAAMAFRRTLLDIALPIPLHWIHDAWLAVLAAATGRVGIIDDALIDYRQHGGNQIGMRSRTLKTRLSEFRLPRNLELRAEASRLDALTERVAMGGSHIEALSKVAEHRAHVARRIALSDLGWAKRLPIVVREWLSGGYARFATGHRTALRDLLRKG